MSNEKPPQAGLTRDASETGVKHGMYSGWYLTRKEYAAVKRRSAQRQTEAGTVPEEAIGRPPMRAVASNVTPTLSLAESRRAIKRRDWARRTGETGETG